MTAPWGVTGVSWGLSEALLCPSCCQTAVSLVCSLRLYPAHPVLHPGFLGPPFTRTLAAASRHRCNQKASLCQSLGLGHVGGAGARAAEP